jgi:O-antigen ligase
MLESKQLKWMSRLDNFCIIVGSMVPVGIMLGNIAFESMTALVGIGWITRSIIAKENPVPGLLRHPLILPWLFWVGIIIISVTWNGAGSKGWAHDVVLIRFIIYFAALLDISKRRHVSNFFVIGLAAGVVFGGINILLAYSIGYDVVGRALINYTSKTKETGVIASLAAYTAPFFLAYLFSGLRLNYKMKIAIAFVGCLSVMQIYHANIRTAFIAGIAGLLCFVIYFSMTKNKKAGTFLLLLFTGLFIVLLDQYGLQLINMSTIYSRISIWKVGFVMWLDHPFIGVSVSAWPDFYKDIAASGSVAPYVSPDGHSYLNLETTHAHNLFLQVLGCTGILGFFSFCWLFINLLRLLFQTQVSDWHFGLITWPFVFIVIGLTGWNIFGSQYQTVFTYFMTLTAVSVNRQKEI